MPQDSRDWDLLDDGLLRGMVEAGYTDPEIAQRLRRAVEAIKWHRRRIGLESNSEEPSVRTPPWTALPMSLRYDNITREEARRVMAGAPQSARYTMPHYGRMGCSSAMLVEA